jgi:hypothetical protein
VRGSTGRRAVFRALGNALLDGGKAKHVVDEADIDRVFDARYCLLQRPI